MAIFSHVDRSIVYQTYRAPVDQDLLLLQSSRFDAAVWSQLLEELGLSEAGEGRIVICDWYSAGRESAQLGEELADLVRSLGLITPLVVACEDAVAVVRNIEQSHLGFFAKSLLLDTTPDAAEMGAQVRKFIGIEI